MRSVHAHDTGGRGESTAGHLLGSRVPFGVAESESEHCVAVAKQPGAKQRGARNDRPGGCAEDHRAERPFRRAGR